MLPFDSIHHTSTVSSQLSIYANNGDFKVRDSKTTLFKASPTTSKKFTIASLFVVLRTSARCSVRIMGCTYQGVQSFPVHSISDHSIYHEGHWLGTSYTAQNWKLSKYVATVGSSKNVSLVLASMRSGRKISMTNGSVSGFGSTTASTPSSAITSG